MKFFSYDRQLLSEDFVWRFCEKVENDGRGYCRVHFHPSRLPADYFVESAIMKVNGLASTKYCAALPE